MKSILRLSPEDHADLRNLQSKGQLTTDQILNIEAIVRVAEVTPKSQLLEKHVGLNDRITLVSATDPDDVFVLTIVLPSQEDIDEGRIGRGKPVSVSCLGRKLGELVTWPGPHGIRAMKVAVIQKSGAAVALP